MCSVVSAAAGPNGQRVDEFAGLIDVGGPDGSVGTDVASCTEMPCRT